MDKQLLPYVVEEVVDKQYTDYLPEGVSMINASPTWDKTSYGEGLTVAVIDTGIDKDHPDLKANIIGGEDFTRTGSWEDDNGHGTHVSGTIAGSLNGLGLAGVAPKVNILALKALDARGRGRSAWINHALEYAIDWRGKNGEKVDVISMSLGGPKNSQEYQLIKEAVDNGIMVICAAGNAGDGTAKTDELSYPGAYPEVIEVGAVDFDKNIAHFSNTNTQIDLVAPGVGIISTYKDGQYARLSGTSMATPHVSGGAALIKIMANDKFGRELDTQRLYAQLLKHTDEIKDISPKAQGNGVLNVAKELNKQQKNNDEPLNIKVVIEPQNRDSREVELRWDDEGGQ